MSSGRHGISDVRITGPAVLENSRQQWVDLACRFSFDPADFKQLDIKWYFERTEEPFLQWVPSAGRRPQTIGPRWRSRVSSRHAVTNSSEGWSAEQVVRVAQPSILTSGTYHCKVATFTTETIASHRLLIFGENHVHPERFPFTCRHCRPGCRALPLLQPHRHPHRGLLCGHPGLPRAPPLPLIVLRAGRGGGGPPAGGREHHHGGCLPAWLDTSSLFTVDGVHYCAGETRNDVRRLGVHPAAHLALTSNGFLLSHGDPRHPVLPEQEDDVPGGQRVGARHQAGSVRRGRPTHRLILAASWMFVIKERERGETARKST